MVTRDLALQSRLAAALDDVAVGAPVTVADIAALQALARQVAPDGASVEAFHRTRRHDPLDREVVIRLFVGRDLRAERILPVTA